MRPLGKLCSIGVIGTHASFVVVLFNYHNVGQSRGVLDFSDESSLK